MKKDIKKELLQSLKADMKKMMLEDKKPILERLLPKPESMEHEMEEGEGMQKVTVMADSKEGLEKGLSKAQQIMKAKLGKKSEK
jgi:hypothetical protein